MKKNPDNSGIFFHTDYEKLKRFIINTCINKMSTNLPNEIISRIVEYVSERIGFDYKYCRYRKTWQFLYNKNNKICKIINNLITNTWCVRRFYDMSNPKNKILEKQPNFISPSVSFKECFRFSKNSIFSKTILSGIFILVNIVLSNNFD